MSTLQQGCLQSIWQVLMAVSDGNDDDDDGGGGSVVVVMVGGRSNLPKKD